MENNFFVWTLGRDAFHLVLFFKGLGASSRLCSLCLQLNPTFMATECYDSQPQVNVSGHLNVSHPCRDDLPRRSLGQAAHTEESFLHLQAQFLIRFRT